MSGLLTVDEDGLQTSPLASNDKKNNLRGCNDGPTEIQRFYSGASVLVTGATGFMGKVLIEKLLRSCPDIDSIYMMVREKKGRSLEERIDDVIGSPCFDRVKREQPEFRSKLHAVAGDIGEVGLGITDSDRHLLEQQINIVFHVAATVRFDEHLKLAILHNVRGTREVLNFCRNLEKVKAMVHVSTAYSNCPISQIDERFYEPHLPSEQFIHLAETTDTTTLDRLSHKLMGDWPNTYAFTKALSEDIVRIYGKELPVALVRPSIVVCTISEPMIGWIDNYYGPTGVMAATAGGLMRTMHLDLECEANLVPCDMSVNAIIASAWDVAENRTSAEIPVYNYVSTRTNPISWKRYFTICLSLGLKYPVARAIWVPTMTTFKNKTLYLFFRTLVHMLPALLIDLFYVATNKSPQMVKIYDKVHKFSVAISYFATRQWDFESENVKRMWKRLSYRDQQVFSFDMDSLNWDRYVKDSFPRLRYYILRSPGETSFKAAELKRDRLMILHRLLKTVIYITAFWTLVKVTPLLWTLLWSAVRHSPLSAIVLYVGSLYYALLLALLKIIRQDSLDRQIQEISNISGSLFDRQ